MARTVIITGGSKGLGAELVSKFMDEGWNVATFARHIEESRLPRNHGKLLALTLDMRIESEADLFYDEVVKRFGSPELLILNAGAIVKKGKVRGQRILGLRQVVETNLFANVYLTQKFLNLVENGTVVHITSDVSLNPYPEWIMYGSSKRAMDYFIEGLRLEEPAFKFLSIDPGDMNTDMHHEADPTADPQQLISSSEGASNVISLLRKEGAI